MKIRMLTGLVAAVVLLSVVPVLADAGNVGEVLYLSDRLSTEDGISEIYRVDLDTTSSQANLTPLPDAGYGPGVIPFNTVLAIAATPDGSRIYALDSTRFGTGMLGFYDLATATWTEVAVVTYDGEAVPRIVQAAFSPDGNLYVGSRDTDSLYLVDTETAEATLVGQVVNQATGTTVDIVGGDLIFAADGASYLWVNRERAGAPMGAYAFSLPATDGMIPGTYLGPADAPPFFTGLALRANGFGDLVGSNRLDDEIVVLAKSDASMVETFSMFEDGVPYDHTGGDLTTGPLALCTKTTRFWKAHPWDGAEPTICGISVEEREGKRILRYANRRNFSMLFAQLIAAKLNVNNSTGIAQIDDAEAWLCAQPGIVIPEGSLNWRKTFDSRQQKYEATGFWMDLARFNQRCACD